MMIPSILKLTLVLFLMLSSHVGAQNSSSFEFEYLNVPASKFEVSIQSIIGIVQKVMSILSRFAGKSNGFRLTNAIKDCIDLMDMSIDQLRFTLSVHQNHDQKYNSTGNVGADMKTWLSGTLINQDTCKDGFDDSNNNIVKSLIVGLLNKVNSMVIDTLMAVKKTLPKENGSTGRKLLSNDQFPEWLQSHDRKLLEEGSVANPDAVVAADGTGQFTTIEDAVKAAPEYSPTRYVIYVKRGVYKENVEIGKKKWNIMMIGDGVGATVISGNRNNVDGWTTYRSATFAVKGQGFVARDITFENTAGPEKHQAVAFRSDSDLSAMFRCEFLGYQDTLYAHSQRQFYRDCKITGTVDFIFGDGSAVFQNCQIQARRGLPEQKNTITAQGRKESVEDTGFTIQSSNITVETDVLSNSTLTYLGRPWKLYSRTVVIKSYIGEGIKPEGWLEWDGNYALDTLYYGEYENYGPGAGLTDRVKWPGYHVLDDPQANNFTVSQLILGDIWLPSTGVTYANGLS